LYPLVKDSVFAAGRRKGARNANHNALFLLPFSATVANRWEKVPRKIFFISKRALSIMKIQKCKICSNPVQQRCGSELILFGFGSRYFFAFFGFGF
jgi:hypothetical protein